MTVEDRVRAAIRARGDLVREIRPLELPSIPQRRPSVRRSLLMWVAPATAVVTVAALAIALVSVRQSRQAPAVHHLGPTISRYSLPGTPPRYYVALDDPVGNAYSDPLPHAIQGRVNVVVGDARTGKTLATVSPPHGLTFAGVTGAADDRTFVVAASSFPLFHGGAAIAPVAWYLLRIAPGTGHPAQLTRLSIGAQPRVDGVALSPDGRQLAILTQDDPAPAESLTVYSVRTGKAVRTWGATGQWFGLNYWGRISNNSIAWLADGHTLAFVTSTALGGANGPLGGGAGGELYGGMTLRELDLARPGSSLLGDSTKVSFQHPWCDTLQLSAYGTTALCGRNSLPDAKSTASDPEFLAYSLATGKSRVLYLLKNGTWALGIGDVLWASPDGSTLIGSVNEQSEVGGVGPNHPHRAIGLITNGHFEPYTIPLHDGPPAAGVIAF